MNYLKLLGCALIAFAFYFLWVYVLMALVVGYNLVTGQGLGIEFAGGHAVLGFLAHLVGVVPLAVGIYLVKKSYRWRGYFDRKL